MQCFKFKTDMEGFHCVRLAVLLSFFLIQKAHGLSCTLSQQCDCVYKQHQTDLTCDIARSGRPWFTSNIQEVQRSVTVTGAHYLPDYLFTGLKVRNVRLSGLNLTTIGCALLFGLESVLQTLDLSNNALSSVPTCTLKSMRALRSLNLSENRITNLNQKDFLLVPTLTNLDLSGNQISVLPDGAFAGLTRLSFLGLSRNNLTGGFETVAASVLQSLEILDLSHNQIVHFGNSAVTIPSLKHLYLNDNLLSTFAMWKNSGNVIVLSLRNNKLEKLYEHVFTHYTALEKLDLSQNRLKTVPDFIWILHNLGYLNVSKNRLDALDLKRISQFANARMFYSLDFSNNIISSIGQGTIFARREFELKLNGNRLNVLPVVTIASETDGNTSISINLSHNKLKTAPYFRMLYTRISHGDNKLHIDLSHNVIDNVNKMMVLTSFLSSKMTYITCILRNNRLQYFPRCLFTDLQFFTFLDLSQNLMSEVPASSCTGYRVREMVLDYNLIEKVPPLIFNETTMNTTLQSLSLVGNQIHSIDPDAFAEVSDSLQVIDLRDNNLRIVPPNVFALQSLERLRLQGNPMHCECSQGLRDTRTYNCSEVVDNTRCLTPSKARGFLLKCLWRFCNNSCFLRECSQDQFIEVETNVTQTDSGFRFYWQLHGPGKWSQIRLNISGDQHTAPTSIYLLRPKDKSYNFVDTRPGRKYTMCVEALSRTGKSLGSRCFQNVTHLSNPSQEGNPIQNPTKEHPPIYHEPTESTFYVNSLKVGLAVVSVICIISWLLILVFFINRYRKRHKNDPYRLSSHYNDPFTKQTSFYGVLNCFKSKKRKENKNHAVVFSELQTNSCQNLSGSNPRESDLPCDSVHPLLPTRKPTGNSARKKIKKNPSKQHKDGHVAPTANSSGKKRLDPPLEKKFDGFDSKREKEDNNTSCKNVYAPGVNLQVNLDRLSAEFNESDEHIYEETVPLEYVTKSYKNSKDINNSDGTPKEDDSFGAVGGSRNPSACDGAVGGYECPRTIKPNSQKRRLVSRNNNSAEDKDSAETYCNTRYLGNPMYDHPENTLSVD